VLKGVRLRASVPCGGLCHGECRHPVQGVQYCTCRRCSLVLTVVVHHAAVFLPQLVGDTLPLSKCTDGLTEAPPSATQSCLGVSCNVYVVLQFRGGGIASSAPVFLLSVCVAHVRVSTPVQVPLAPHWTLGHLHQQLRQHVHCAGPHCHHRGRPLLPVRYYSVATASCAEAADARMGIRHDACP
jgi:hypothetical protein